MMYEIDPVVLERGRDYLLEGRVQSLEESDKRVYHAVVKGQELYHVEFEIGDEGEIFELRCDCPYDYGPVCKHEAAVLLMVSGASLRTQPEFTEMDMNQATYSADTTQKSGANLQSLLESQTKASLIDLLLSLASGFPLVERRIRLSVSTNDIEAEVGDCREYICSYIDGYADRDGFVSYRNASQAVDGAYHIIERAQRALEDEDYVRSLRISFCILEEMLSLIERADDSDGSIGMVITESMEHIFSVVMAVKHLDTADIDRVFQLLLQESQLPQLDGWSDWRLDLIQCAAELTTTPERLCVWEEYVDRVTSHTGHTAWGREYDEKRIAKMRYKMILECDGEVQAADFVLSHLHIPEMRSLAIRRTLEHEQYDEAIHLAKEGEDWAKQSGYRGLVSEWRKLRFEAYSRSGQLEHQRSLGLELVLDGDYTFYLLVKETYASSEWSPIYESLMRKFDERGTGGTVYTQILISEQDTSRLLKYVSREPSRIEQYYRHLVPQHLAEVTALFLSHIRESAERSSNRSAYRGVCRIIIMLYKAGGRNEARKITQELLETYPRKPAFREELLSLQF